MSSLAHNHNYPPTIFTEKEKLFEIKPLFFAASFFGLELKWAPFAGLKAA